jgi:hypothetical protein
MSKRTFVPEISSAYDFICASVFAAAFLTGRGGRRWGSVGV